ncbi:MAG: alpha/beta hydrolase [Parachlamydiaceae bacterium]
MSYTPIYDGCMLTKAKKGLILLHGRGGSAHDILRLAPLLVDDRFFVAALNAPQNSWYPHSFLHENNEPKLSESIQALNHLIEETAEYLPLSDLFIAGFSQGACLALETTARNAKKYGGILAFSGGLIGKSLEAEKYGGDYQKTKIFIGSSDKDPHIPDSRLIESKTQLEKLNADCTLTIYPGMGHTISQDEIAFAKKHILKKA